MPARFTQRLKIKEAIETLILAVSMSNDRQKEGYFKEFIDLLNRHNEQELKIKTVQILLSCSLQRHYIGKEAAEKIGDKWIAENTQHLEGLLYGAKHNIVRWSDLTSSKEYESTYREVVSLYGTNDEFKTIISNLVKRHAPKADEISAKNYLFEECTVFLLLKNSHISYPSNELNAAVEFIIRYFHSDIKYHGYAFYNKSIDSKLPKKNEIKEKISYRNRLDSSEEKKLKIEIMAISKKMQSFGLKDKSKQIAFFKKAIQAPCFEAEIQTPNNNQPGCSVK